MYMYVQYLTDTQVANMFCVVDDFLAKAPCYFCSYSLQIIKLRVANYLCNRSNHTHKHTTGLSVNFIASISLSVLPLQVQIAIFRNIFAFAQYTCDHVSYCKILSKRSAWAVCTCGGRSDCSGGQSACNDSTECPYLLLFSNTSKHMLIWLGWGLAHGIVSATGGWSFELSFTTKCQSHTTVFFTRVCPYSMHCFYMHAECISLSLCLARV